MTHSWRTLEREVISILRENNFPIVHMDGETFVRLDPHDFAIKFSLETFAKELAKRLETVK